MHGRAEGRLSRLYGHGATGEGKPHAVVRHGFDGESRARALRNSVCVSSDCGVCIRQRPAPLEYRFSLCWLDSGTTSRNTSFPGLVHLSGLLGLCADEAGEGAPDEGSCVTDDDGIGVTAGGGGKTGALLVVARACLSPLSQIQSMASGLGGSGRLISID